MGVARKQRRSTFLATQPDEASLDTIVSSTRSDVECEGLSGGIS